MIRSYCIDLYASTFEKLDEMNNFLGKFKIANLMPLNLELEAD